MSQETARRQDGKTARRQDGKDERTLKAQSSKLKAHSP
jgi:hypothetical protein